MQAAKGVGGSGPGWPPPFGPARPDEEGLCPHPDPLPPPFTGWLRDLLPGGATPPPLRPRLRGPVHPAPLFRLQCAHRSTVGAVGDVGAVGAVGVTIMIARSRPQSPIPVFSGQTIRDPKYQKKCTVY